MSRDDSDEIKGLLLLVGAATAAIAGFKLLRLIFSNERYARMLKDAYGFRRGQVVSLSELREAIQAEEAQQGEVDQESEEETDEEIHCPNCKAVVESKSNLSPCLQCYNWKWVCVSCAHAWSPDTFCSESCESAYRDWWDR